MPSQYIERRTNESFWIWIVRWRLYFTPIDTEIIHSFQNVIVKAKPHETNEIAHLGSYYISHQHKTKPWMCSSPVGNTVFKCERVSTASATNRRSTSIFRQSVRILLSVFPRRPEPRMRSMWPRYGCLHHLTQPGGGESNTWNDTKEVESLFQLTILSRWT